MMKDVKNGLAYSGVSVVLATGLVSLLGVYRPEILSVQEVLVAAVTVLVNGLLVVGKKILDKKLN